MKRHPSLKDLSREHHRALVLARALQRVSDSSAPAEAIEVCHGTFEREVAGHFLLEERELLPLSFCDATLRPLAEAVQAQHDALRKGFAAPRTDAAAHLAQQLIDHVRYEEREWFPALEASLPTDVLQNLQHRLQTTPTAAITDFEQDEDGTWVAQLSCGHGQHIRHKPPFTEAAWVTTAAGRRKHRGVRLACPLCRMPRLPPCATVYRQTPIYDAMSLPAGLRRSHRLRHQRWGRIRVLGGRVQYVLEDEANCTLVLRPGVDGVVAPERPHHITPDSSARVQIDFLRLP